MNEGEIKTFNPQTREQGKFPLAIQSAFEGWVKENLRKQFKRKKLPEGYEVRIDSEELLWVVKGPHSISRMYHLYSPSLAPEEQTFPRMTHAEFIKSVVDKDHMYEPFAVHYYSEAEKEDDTNSATIRFNNLGHNIIILGTNIWFTERGRTLYVEDLENTPEVRFTEKDGKQNVFEIELSREYGIQMFENGVVNEDENQLVIEHTGLELIDQASIPKGLKDDEILAKLFEEEDLLNDPFNAPSSLDYSWRFASPWKLTGIDWKMKPIPAGKITASDSRVIQQVNISLDPNKGNRKTHLMKAKEFGKKIFNSIFKSRP